MTDPCRRRRIMLPLVITGAVALLVGLGGAMFVRANSRVNKVALSETPKGVTVAEAHASVYHTWHRYTGTVSPWVEAQLGPQFTSAYVASVLVRPGAAVRRGQVVATLDCRNASAVSKAIAMHARAIATKQGAMANEAKRVSGLVHGGFVSPNEAEQKTADTDAKQAELLSTQAKLLSASLEVNDCILRAPFDGEVADRMQDPGAFAHPGTALVSVVDRSIVRVTADVPESDFVAVAPGRPVTVHMLSTGERLTARITRRSPEADLSTRTIHLEIDIPNPRRTLPVGTTAELTIEVGQPTVATALPLVAASIRGSQATLFVVQGGVAHKVSVRVVGESRSTLFVDPTLKPGTRVVSEGRSTLKDGDHVATKAPPAAQAASEPPQAQEPARQP